MTISPAAALVSRGESKVPTLKYTVLQTESCEMDEEPRSPNERGQRDLKKNHRESHGHELALTLSMAFTSRPLEINLPNKSVGMPSLAPRCSNVCIVLWGC